MRYSALILLAFASLTGVVEIVATQPMHATSVLIETQNVTHVESAASFANPTANRLGDHYLMLVNSATASQMDAQKLSEFDRSPYDGLAISFGNAFDTSAVRTVPAMEAAIASWKKSTTKDVWPWVYMNRMIGANDAEANEYSKVPYFSRFQGVDLDNKAGAQKDFLENWRNALRVAKDSGFPGIVCDPEFYNNYQANDLGELSKMKSISPQESVKMLRQIGARMADAAAEEYADATLWFLFTGFTRPGYRVVEGKPYYLASTYIAEGLLDRIQERHLSLHVLTGGESGLSYCHSSVEDLRQAIQTRGSSFAPELQKYAGVLEMAGTMTLWSDRSAKRDWVARRACGASSAATLEDLEPYMELLFRTYRYNWIYGSSNGGYFAFRPDSAPRFDAAIRRARTRAFGAEAR